MKPLQPRRLRLAAAAIATAAAALAAVVTPAQPVAAAPIPAGSLVADLGRSTGTFKGAASGTLYGLYDESLPTSNVAEAMGLKSNATKAQDGFNHPGGDAIEANRTMTKIGGDHTGIYMLDWFRSFPVIVPGANRAERLDNLFARYRIELQQIKTLPKTERDRFVYIPFNENSIVETAADDPAFFDAWDRVYRLIKEEMGPDARIAGVNTAGNFEQNRGMLQHMVQAGTLPDFYTWHELGRPDEINRDIKTFRGWEDEFYAGTPMQGKHLQVNINEYGDKRDVAVPGAQVRWITALENNKLWGDMGYYNIQGNLNETSVGSNRGNSQFWLFNSYSQMSGNTVPVSSPGDYDSSLQAIGTLDAKKRQARLLLGGGSGSQNVVMKNVPANVFGSKVHAQVREIAYSGPFGDSTPPNVVGQLDLTVEDGNVQLPFGAALPALRADSAYEVILTPYAGKPSSQPMNRQTFKGVYEFEDAACTGVCNVNPTNKFYNSGGANVGGFDSTADTTRTFTVNVPTTGTYDLSLFGNSPFTNSFVPDYDGPVNVFVRADGSAATEQQVFLTVANDFELWGHSDTRIKLSAGTHTITVATRSLDGKRKTIGGAILDKMELSLPNPKYPAEVYEAEYGAKITGTVGYVKGQSGPGVVNLTSGKSVTFWVHSTLEAPSVLKVAADSDDYTVAVNGKSLGSTAESTVFLQGGINKVVVRATGTIALDRISVQPKSSGQSTTYQAENANVGGSAEVAVRTQATGGKDVTSIGGDPGNENDLTFRVSAPYSGTYAMTVRYANGETARAYNPYNAAVDPVARIGWISVNNGAETMRTFPSTFNQNGFQELTQYVKLKAGKNTVRIAGHERPLFDGKTLISSLTTDGATDIDPTVSPLRSKYAPDIDSIRVTPFVLAG